MEGQLPLGRADLPALQTKGRQLPAGLEDFLDQFRLEHGLDPTGYSDPIAAMEEGLHRLYEKAREVKARQWN